MPMKIDAKLGLDVFKLDKEPHIVIDTEVCKTVCTDEACVYVCPADLYERDDQGRMTVNWEGCLECGTLPDVLRPSRPHVEVPERPVRGAVPDELRGRVTAWTSSSA